MDRKIFFTAFVIFFTIFFKFDGLNPTILGWATNALLLIMVCINYKAFGMLFNPNNRILNLLSLTWLGIILYTGYDNQDLSYDNETWDGLILESMASMRFDHVLYYVLKLFFCVCYYQYLNKIGKGRIFIKYFFQILVVYAAISDLNALTYKSMDGSGYLIGNKFYVCYVNTFVVTLYFILHPLMENKYKKVGRILLLITFLIAIKTECSTVILGSAILYYLLFYLKDNWKPKLYDWKIYLLGLVVFDILFFFFTMSFIDNEFMRFLIVDVLGEDMTLTGRLDIYGALGALLISCPLWGYGMGNGHMVTMMNGVGANAQNGLFNLMLEIGILGVVAYLLLLFCMFKKASIYSKTYSLVCFVYMMLVLSSIEVTFTTYFFAMSLFLILDNRDHVVLR